MHLHAELLNLPILLPGETGPGMSEEEMYKCVSNMMQFVILDNDPAESFNLRRRARDSVKKLKAVTEERVKNSRRNTGMLGSILGTQSRSAPAAGSLKEVGYNLTRELQTAGYSVENTATTLLTSAAGGIPNLPNAVSSTPISRFVSF
jgi:hypothetical protein